METKEWRFTDKARWSRGPWDAEPDKRQWQDAATGLPCLIVRGPSGALCGYVGVSRSHPGYAKDYDDVAAGAHGGLTFADRCQPSAKEYGICHVVAPGDDDDVWWLGFDCAHAGDLCPSYSRYLPSGYETYRDWVYVEGEVRELALQLKAMES